MPGYTVLLEDVFFLESAVHTVCKYVPWNWGTYPSLVCMGLLCVCDNMGSHPSSVPCTSDWPVLKALMLHQEIPVLILHIYTQDTANHLGLWSQTVLVLWQSPAINRALLLLQVLVTPSHSYIGAVVR